MAFLQGNTKYTCKQHILIIIHNVWFQKLSIPCPRKVFFLRPPLPLWKFQSSFIHLLKFLGLWEPPTPQDLPIPSVGGVWISIAKSYQWVLLTGRSHFSIVTVHVSKIFVFNLEVYHFEINTGILTMSNILQKLYRWHEVLPEFKVGC